MLDLARHLGLKAIGTCSANNVAAVERFGATAIDYRAGDFVAAVRELTAGRKGQLASMQPSMRLAVRISHDLLLVSLLVAYSSATVRRRWPLAAPAWRQRHSVWRDSNCGTCSAAFSAAVTPCSTTLPRRSAYPKDFKADVVTLFDLLRDRAIHPIVIDRLPLAAARHAHTPIDVGGLGGKIVLLPWPQA
jgi:NADPH:quinone reductase-like Zn-dependent oxidoreductase